MTQIEYILSLKHGENVSNSLWEKSKQVLHAPDARAVFENPGKLLVREILGSSRIHLKSLHAANVVAVGLDELILCLERIDSLSELFCYGFASDSLSVIGSCYVTKDEELIGCMWVPVLQKTG